ncbi:MAG: hypothetical protein KGJ89_02370 [Patescibacteria group bacterium]|nr:hypothetical protein [Patescibacteria group bacterium]MDE2015722.1 hypothetical protein [Patescibacteria group bacterium]MDE2226780.1 hypothetical protein [Patescibacteria group bacterium]
MKNRQYVVIYSESEDFSERWGRKLSELGFRPAVFQASQSTTQVPYRSATENDVALVFYWNSDARFLDFIYCPIVLVVPSPIGNFKGLRILGALSEECTDQELRDAVKAAMKLNKNPQSKKQKRQLSKHDRPNELFRTLAEIHRRA